MNFNPIISLFALFVYLCSLSIVQVQAEFYEKRQQKIDNKLMNTVVDRSREFYEKFDKARDQNAQIMQEYKKLANFTNRNMFKSDTQSRVLGDEDFVIYYGFDGLNDYLIETTLLLPDINLEELPFPFPSSAKIHTYNFECFDIQVQNIKDRIKNEVLKSKYVIVFDDLEVSCKFDWTYFKGRFVQDNGKATIYTKRGKIELEVDIMRESFHSSVDDSGADVYPTIANATKCLALITITNMKFSGGLRAGLVNAIEKSIRENVGKQVEEIICSKLKESVSAGLTNVLNSTIARIEPYLEIDLNDIDPLEGQKKLSLPSSIDLLDFKGKSFSKLSNSLDNLLGNMIEDLEGPKREMTGMDLGINVLIRETLLDENRILRMPKEILSEFTFRRRSDTSSMFDIEIEIASVDIKGLDTYTAFENLKALSSQTLQNHVHIEFLEMSANIKVHLRPTQPNSTQIFHILHPGTVENFRVQVGIRNIDALISVFMALDLEAIGELQFVNILDATYFLPCFQSISWGAEITQLEFFIGKPLPPLFNGFISPGLDRLLTTFTEELRKLYGDAFGTVMPNFIGTYFRNAINSLDNNEDNMLCPKYASLIHTSTEDYIDFRDLFMSATEAAAAGASGNSPYGALTSKIMQIIKEYISEENSDDFPVLNEDLIDPFTKSQSGIEGTFFVGGDEINIFETSIDNNVGVGSFRTSLKASKVENLNTIGYPMMILQPSPNKPYILENEVNMGTGRRPLRFATRLISSFLGGSISEHNEINLSFELKNLNIWTSIMAKVNVKDFMEFPLKDVRDLNCWMSTIAIPEFDDQRISVGKSLENSASIEEIKVNAENIKLKVECISCSSKGFEELPMILSLMERSGVKDLLTLSILNSLENTLKGDFASIEFHRALIDARRRCPHHPLFDEYFTMSNYSNANTGSLFSEASETILFASFVFVQAAVIMVALSVTEYQLDNASDPLSAQMTLQAPHNIHLLDFNDLTSTTTGALIKILLDIIEQQLGGLEEVISGGINESDLGINVKLRSMLLESDGSYKINFDDDTFSFGNIMLEGVRLVGLDTFTLFEGLNPIASQTLESHLQLKNLDIELMFTVIKSKNEKQEIVFPIKMSNLKIDMAILLAINEGQFQGIQLGLVLDSDLLLHCALLRLSKVSISQFLVSVDRIHPPEANGNFLSDDIRQAMSIFSKALFHNYESHLNSFVTLIFDTTARKALNKIASNLLEEAPADACALQNDISKDTYIDFRDLLLDPYESKQMGGSGQMQYGDITSKAFNIAVELLSSVDENGSSGINNFVRSYTESNSGIPGAIIFPISDSCFPTVYKINGFQIAIRDIRFENLDSFAHPSTLLKPVAHHPQHLASHITIGSGLDPFRITTILELSLNNKYTTEENKIQISLDVRNASILASFVVKVYEKAFMEFPLKNAGNLYCWLSTIAIDDQDVLPLETNDILNGVDEINVDVENMQLRTECISCSSKGMKELPIIVSKLQSSGSINEILTSAIALFEETMKGLVLKSAIRNIVLNGPKRCNSNLLFDKNQRSKETDCSDDTLVLPENFYEIVISSMILIFQAGVVVTTLSMAEYQLDNASDPLSAQMTLQAPHNIHLLDFNDLTSTTTGALIKILLDIIEQQLGGLEEVISGGINESDLGINVKLRSMLLESDGSYKINFDDDTFSFGNIMLEGVRLVGLDTFTLFEGLNPIASQTLESHLQLKNLDIELVFAIKKKASLQMPISESIEATSFYRTSYNEHMILSLRINNLDIKLFFFVVINQLLLENIQLSSILHSESLLQCLLSCILEFQSTQSLVTIGRIDHLKIRGFISKKIAQSIYSSTKDLFAAYESEFKIFIQNLFDQFVRDLFNKKVKEYMEGKVEGNCFGYEKKERNSFIDFRDFFFSPEDAIVAGASGGMPYGDIAATLFDFVMDHFIAPDDDNLPKLNSALIRPLTKAQSNIAGTFYFPGDLFEQTVFLNASTSIDDTILFQIQDVRIENIDSVGYPLKVLQPHKNPYILSNQLTMGISPNHIRFSGRIRFSIQGDSSNVHNEIDVTLELHNPSIKLPFAAKVDEELFLSLPLSHLSNIYCWLSCIPSPRLNEFGFRREDETLITAALLDIALSVNELHLALKCISCSGKSFEKLGDLLESPKGRSMSTELGKRLLSATRDVLIDGVVQDWIDRLLNKAEVLCQRENSSTLNDFLPLKKPTIATNALKITFGLVGFLAAISLIRMTLRHTFKKKLLRKHNKWVANLSHEEALSFYVEQQNKDQKVKSLCYLTKPMYSADQIPLLARILLPIIIICNIGLFISGHLSLGATIRADILIGGQDIIVQDFFKFSIAQSISGMWKGGLKAFAVILFICSVLWPYTKQMIILVLFFATPSRVSATKRGSIFLKLDALGKWSMTDIYVLMITLIVFRITLKSPQDGNLLPLDLYGIDMMIVPLWGLYANMIAQFLSQITSHFIIYYHRKIVDAGNKAFDLNEMTTSKDHNYGLHMNDENNPNMNSNVVDNETKKSLCNHFFSLKGHKNVHKSHVPIRNNRMIAVFGCITIFLLVLGCFLPSFRLEMHGMIGLLIDVGNESEGLVQHHSVLTMARVILDEAKYLNGSSHYIGLGVLILLLVSTSLTVPCLQVAAVLILWFYPMTQQQNKRVVLFIEILQAWQYVEVYVIASFLGMWQMGR